MPGVIPCHVKNVTAFRVYQNISGYTTYAMKCQRAHMHRDGLSIFQ